MARTSFERAVAQLADELQVMGGQARAALDETAATTLAFDEARVRGVLVLARSVSERARGLEDEAVTLMTLQAPVAGDLRRIISIISVGRELERISGHAGGIAKAARRLERREPLPMTPPSVAEVLGLTGVMLTAALAAFAGADEAAARRVWADDDRVDAWYHSFRTAVLDGAAAAPERVETALEWLRLGHDVERIGDRVTNICERAVFVATGVIGYSHAPGTGSTALAG